jgi:hypothetical protein
MEKCIHVCTYACTQQTIDYYRTTAIVRVPSHPSSRKPECKTTRPTLAAHVHSCQKQTTHRSCASPPSAARTPPKSNKHSQPTRHGTARVAPAQKTVKVHPRTHLAQALIPAAPSKSPPQRSAFLGCGELHFFSFPMHSLCESCVGVGLGVASRRLRFL